GPLVPVGHRHEGTALDRQGAVGGRLGFGVRGAELRVDPHHLAGGPHLRAEDGVHAAPLGVGEPVEREHHLLDRDRRLPRHAPALALRPPSPPAGSRPSPRSRATVSPSMIRAAALATGTPVPLDTNGTVRDARGLASSTYSTPAASAYWTFSSPRTPTPRAMASVDSRIRS